MPINIQNIFNIKTSREIFGSVILTPMTCDRAKIAVNNDAKEKVIFVLERGLLRRMKKKIPKLITVSEIKMALLIKR